MKIAKTKRYISLPHYHGIQKEIKTNSYLVTKSIKGKRYYETLDTLRDAVNWKNTFHPEVISKKHGKVGLQQQQELNGKDRGMTFKENWDLYLQIKVSMLEKSTINFVKTYTEFFSYLHTYNMAHIFPETIDEFIQAKKQKAILVNSQRMNFDHPLSQLKVFFNWYRENYDFKFINPVLKRHYAMGMIKKSVERNKKMTAEEVLLFFAALDDFFRDFAMVQFFVAGRVSEVAGLQFSSLDHKTNTIIIKHVVVWDHGKHFIELRPYPKNKEVRFCYMNDALKEILERRFKSKKNGSDYVFHVNGEPVSYRQVQHAYNKALKKCGLADKYSSTHIMRHSMATITRQVTGSIDATQAVTGHKDLKLVQHYATLPSFAQKDAVIAVGNYMKKVSACEQVRANEESEKKKLSITGS